MHPRQHTGFNRSIGPRAPQLCCMVGSCYSITPSYTNRHKRRRMSGKSTETHAATTQCRQACTAARKQVRCWNSSQYHHHHKRFVNRAGKNDRDNGERLTCHEAIAAAALVLWLTLLHIHRLRPLPVLHADRPQMFRGGTPCATLQGPRNPNSNLHGSCVETTSVATAGKSTEHGYTIQ